MIKKLIFIMFIGIQSLAYAAELSITSTCEQKLKTELLKQASFILQRPVMASEVTLEKWSNSQNFNIALTSNIDGAYLVFTAPATLNEVQSCQLIPRFNTNQSCRYSNYGTADISEIIQYEGINGEISDDSELSVIEKSQILTLLEDGTADTSLNEHILNTDDQLVIYELVTLPDGTELDYYSAYRGDTIFGNYYYKGTHQIAGDNSDGNICIKFSNK